MCPILGSCDSSAVCGTPCVAVPSDEGFSSLPHSSKLSTLHAGEMSTVQMFPADETRDSGYMEPDCSGTRHISSLGMGTGVFLAGRPGA